MAVHSLYPHTGSVTQTATMLGQSPIRYPSVVYLPFIAIGLALFELSPSTASPEKCAEMYSSQSFRGNLTSILNLQVVHDVPLSTLMTQGKDGRNSSYTFSSKIEPRCALKIIVLHPSEDGDTTQAAEFDSNVELGEILGPTSSSSTATIKCRCHSKEKCSCDAVRFLPNQCGMGYILSSCNVCDSPYTTFPNDGKRKVVHERVRGKMSSFLLRNGCNLNLHYSNGTTEGFSNLEMGAGHMEIHRIQSDGITEISCRCSGNERPQQSVNNTLVGGRARFPPLLSIPSTRSGINLLLRRPDLTNHPGLTASLQSILQKRSPTNAYILLLGLTGSWEIHHYKLPL